MEELIAPYLFINKNCPLPTLGTLQVIEGNSSLLMAEKKISPGIPFIVFNRSEADPSTFVKYIAEVKKVPVEVAGSELSSFCNKIRSLQSSEEKFISDMGKFYLDEQGKLQFKQVDLPAAFFKPVKAERVIRRDAIHAVQVGDRETTTAAMTDFFTETPVSGQSRWWIAAMIIAIVATAIMIYHYNLTSSNDFTGNGRRIEPRSEMKTYEIR